MESKYNSTLLRLWEANWSHLKQYILILPIAFVVFCGIILLVPRKYQCQVVLVPEAPITKSILNPNADEDAFLPTMYPEVVKGQAFILNLFNTPLTSQDGKFSGTYYEYLTKGKGKADETFDPFYLTELQHKALKSAREDISCRVDNHTDLVRLSVMSKDRKISATVADSICSHLQAFMTEYRTSKQAENIRYYERMTTEAELEYLKASEEYGTFMDSHKGTTLQQYIQMGENLKHAAEIKFDVYADYQGKLQEARAQYQQRKPVFTIIEPASMPYRAAKPKRVVFVLLMTILTACCMALYYSKDILIDAIEKP